MQTLKELAHTAASFGVDDLMALAYHLLGEIGPDDAGLLHAALAEAQSDQEYPIMQTMAEIWMAEGEARGLAIGEAKGREKGRAEMLIGMLNRRFGDVPEHMTARLDGASIEDLDTWADRIFDAKTLEDVFGGRVT